MSTNEVKCISFCKFNYSVNPDTTEQLKKNGNEIEIKIQNYIKNNVLTFDSIKLLDFKIIGNNNYQSVYFYDGSLNVISEILSDIKSKITISSEYDCIVVKSLNTDDAIFYSKDDNQIDEIPENNNIIQKYITAFEEDISNFYNTSTLIEDINIHIDKLKIKPITIDILKNKNEFYKECENIYSTVLENLYNSSPHYKKIHALNDGINSTNNVFNKIITDINKCKLSDFIKKLNTKYEKQNKDLQSNIEKFEYLKYIEYLQEFVRDLKSVISRFKNIDFNVKENKELFDKLDKELEKKVNNAIITYVKINSTNEISQYRKHRFRFYLDKNRKNMIVQYNDLHLSYNETKYEEDNQIKVLFDNQPKYLLGNFTKIFTIEETNAQIVEQMNNIIEQTLKVDPPPIFIVGYGASGAGKTSNLIYLRKDEKSQDGILPVLCKKIIDEHENKNKNKNNKFQKIVLNVKEYSVYELEGQNGQNGKTSFDSNEYGFIMKDNRIVLNDNFRDVKIHHKYRFDFKLDDKELEKYNIIKNRKESTGEDTFEFKIDTELGNVIVFLVDVDRIVKATTNNPQSSRSHVLVFVEIYIGDKIVKLIVGDFAGVENRFLCDNENTIKRMGELKKTLKGKTDETFYMNQSVYNKNIANFDTIRGGEKKISKPLISETDTNDILDIESTFNDLDLELQKYSKYPLFSAFFDIYIKTYILLEKESDYNIFLNENLNIFGSNINKKYIEILNNINNKITTFTDNNSKITSYKNDKLTKEKEVIEKKIKDLKQIQSEDAKLNTYNTLIKSVEKYTAEATGKFTTLNEAIKTLYKKEDDFKKKIDDLIRTNYSNNTITTIIEKIRYGKNKAITNRLKNGFFHNENGNKYTSRNGYNAAKYYKIIKIDFEYTIAKMEDNIPNYELNGDINDSLSLTYTINYAKQLLKIHEDQLDYSEFGHIIFKHNEMTIPITVYLNITDKDINIMLRINDKIPIEVNKVDTDLFTQLKTIYDKNKQNLLNLKKESLNNKNALETYTNSFNTLYSDFEKVNENIQIDLKEFTSKRNKQNESFTNLNRDLTEKILKENINEEIKDKYNYTIEIPQISGENIDFNYELKKEDFVLYYIKQESDSIDFFKKYITKQYFLYTACTNRLAEGDWINYELKELRKAIEIVVKSKDFDVFYNYNDSCFSEEYKPDNLSKSTNIEDAKKNTFIQSILEHYSCINNNFDINYILEKMVICIYCVFNYGYKDTDEPPSSPYLNIDDLNRIKINDDIGKQTFSALAKLLKDLTRTTMTPFSESTIIIKDIINNLTAIGYEDPPYQLDLFNFIYNLNPKIQNVKFKFSHILQILECIRNHINILNATSAMGSLEFIDQVAKLNTVKYLCTYKGKEIDSKEYTHYNVD